jgi:hypothetical protein
MKAAIRQPPLHPSPAKAYVVDREAMAASVAKANAMVGSGPRPPTGYTAEEIAASLARMNGSLGSGRRAVA